MFKVSLPTPKQWTDLIHYVVIGFVTTLVASWTAQPNPFSKTGLVAALGAAVGAAAGLLKGFLTTV